MRGPLHISGLSLFSLITFVGNNDREVGRVTIDDVGKRHRTDSDTFFAHTVWKVWNKKTFLGHL